MFASKQFAWIAVGATTLTGPSALDTCQAGSPTGSVEGNVVIVTVPVDGGSKTDFVLFVDEANGPLAPDGKSDRIFKLQAEGKAPDDVRRRISEARVVWSPDLVLVRGASGPALTFALSEVGTDPLGSTFTGFGLSHLVGRSVTLPAELNPEEYSGLVEAGAPSSVGKCNGGKGSTSCGVSCGGNGCSVTCSAGYPPCCKCGFTGVSCSCVKEAPN